MRKPVPIGAYPEASWTKSLPRACFLERDAVIVDACRGKSVLHIGAADAPFDFDKGQRGELLHQKVRAVAGRTVGVDIDRDAVHKLRGLGIDDILVADIIADGDAIKGETFDLVLCCDVIEHVTNPGDLLGACRRAMASHSQLLVTTINATALKPALRALFGREAVHHDHTSYYSYATLCQLLLKCGLRPLAFGAFSYPTVSPVLGRAMRWLMMFRPGTADGIFLTAARGDAL